MRINFTAVPRVLKPWLTPGLEQMFAESAHPCFGFRLLIHDWSTDPLYRDQNPPLARVVRAQVAGLRALAAGEQMERVFQRFIAASGLLERVGERLGTRPVVRATPSQVRT